MARHPIGNGALAGAVTYLALRFVFFAGPDLGIGNTGSTWSTALVAGAIAAIVVGSRTMAESRRRELLAGFVSAAGGTIAATTLLVLSYLATSNLAETLIAGDVGAAGWTLVIAIIVWVSLLGINLAAGLVTAPLTIVVSRIRTATRG